MIKTTDDITIEERRRRVRELANITETVYTDAHLDEKIQAADHYVSLMTTENPVTDTDTIERIAGFITASNMYTADLIIQGIPDSNPKYKSEIKDIIKALNNTNKTAQTVHSEITSETQDNSFS